MSVMVLGGTCPSVAQPGWNVGLAVTLFPGYDESALLANVERITRAILRADPDVEVRLIEWRVWEHSFEQRAS